MNYNVLYFDVLYDNILYYNVLYYNVFRDEIILLANVSSAKLFFSLAVASK